MTHSHTAHLWAHQHENLLSPWVRASYTSSVRGSYGAERSSQLYEARTELRTSLVLAYELRTSLVSVYELRTSLVYDLLLVYESYTRLVRPPVQPRSVRQKGGWPFFGSSGNAESRHSSQKCWLASIMTLSHSMGELAHLAN